MEWKQDILHGVQNVPKLGVPGRVVIGGTKAQSILSVDKPDDVLIGASEVDDGRIVVFPQDRYLTSFLAVAEQEDLTQLHENVKTWLTRGLYQTDIDVMQLTHSTRPFHIKPGLRILFWSGGNLSGDVINAVVDFVKKGGGLVHGMCPWGWLQLNPGKTLDDMPLYKLLGEAGLGYTTDYLTVPEDGVKVPQEYHEDKAMIWKKDIFSGIVTVPRLGIPGRVSVCKPSAQAILCGHKPEDILIAAAELGKGRIVAIPHGSYSYSTDTTKYNLKQLQKNIKSWLRGTSEQREAEVLLLTENTELSDFKEGTKILFWAGGNLSVEVTDKAQEFVKNGGGLFHTICPWGWLQSCQGKSLEEMSLYSMLCEAGLGYTHDQITMDKEGMKVPQDVRDEITLQWRRDILKGIRRLPKYGVPGRVVVFRHEAQPILNVSKPTDTLMAAGELEKGRIVIVSHNSYSSSFLTGASDKNMAQLHRNIKLWLTHDTYDSDSDILLLSGSTLPEDIKPDLKILFWEGAHLTSDVTAKIVDFIKGGGGLLHTKCPWGWLQLNPSKSLDDMPLRELLEMIGLSYSTDYLSINDDAISIPQLSRSDIKYKSFRQVLDKCIERPDSLPLFADVITYSLMQLRNDAIKLVAKEIEQLYTIYQTDIKTFAPSPKSIVSENKMRALMAIALKMATELALIRKLPGVEIFPGDFDHFVLPLVVVDLEIESHLVDFHSTGFYLPPGETMKVIVKNHKSSPGWSVRVGAHTDDLSGKEYGWRRWPKVTTTRDLKDGELQIISPFGGLVYFISPNNRSKLQVRLERVCESPFFDLCDPKSVENWKTRRDAPGLWADLAGEFITITVPSDTIREIENPSEVMSLWDEIVRAHHHLRGTDPRHYRRQWVVTDEQPVAGYMHAGYPVVTELDVSRPNHVGGNDKWLLDPKTLKTDGAWGLFHELGHNMQRDGWTFEGTVEVTCNIFTLHAMDTVCGRKPWIHKWLKGSVPAIGEYLNQGAQLSTWKSKPGVALGIYAQLVHHFGWSCFQKVFRNYEQGVFKSPKTNQEKIDRWAQCFSEICQHNLLALFEFWGIPVSNEINSLLVDMPVFLPEDEMTTLAPDRLKLIKEQYLNVSHAARNVPKYEFDKSLSDAVVPKPTTRII